MSLFDWLIGKAQTTQVNRRNFLKGTAATVAGTAVASKVSIPEPPEPEFDVLSFEPDIEPHEPFVAPVAEETTYVQQSGTGEGILYIMPVDAYPDEWQKVANLSSFNITMSRDVDSYKTILGKGKAVETNRSYEVDCSMYFDINNPYLTHMQSGNTADYKLITQGGEQEYLFKAIVTNHSMQVSSADFLQTDISMYVTEPMKIT